MTTNQISTIVTEHVDDIPLLLNKIMSMGISELLDTNFPTHGNW